MIATFKKYFFIYLVIYSGFVYAQNYFYSPTGKKYTPEPSYDSIEKLPWYWIEDVKFNFPKTIKANNSRLNLSPVLNELKRISTESKYYQNNSLFSLKQYFKTVFSHACRRQISVNNCVKQAMDDYNKAVDDIKKAQAKKILFPDGYRSIWQKDSKEHPSFKFAKKALDKSSSCASKCKSFSISKAIIFGNSAQFQQLSDKIKTKDKACQKNIVNQLADNFNAIHFPKKCEERSHRWHAVCREILKSLPVIKNRVAGIINMAYGAGATQAVSADTLCHPDGSLKNDVNSPLQILNFIKKVQNQCGDITSGSQKTVITGGTGMRKGSYNLNKDHDGNYSITFPMVFEKGEGYDGPLNVDSHYRKKVQNCLKEASRYMKGPKGEKLKIAISKPPSTKASNNNSCDNKGQKVHRIKIKSRVHRDNSGAYSSDSTCAVITHEILHLTGLCDEYKEKIRGDYVHKQTGQKISQRQKAFLLESHPFFSKSKLASKGYIFQTQYPCRVLTVDESIMSDHKKTWNKVKKEYENGNKKTSLLTPGQFSSIIHGACPQNKNFNKCSQLAYEETKTASCMETKKQCETSNAMGVDKTKLYQTVQDLEREAKKIEFNLQELADPERKKALLAINDPDILKASEVQDRERLKDIKSQLETLKALVSKEKITRNPFPNNNTRQAIVSSPETVIPPPLTGIDNNLNRSKISQSTRRTLEPDIDKFVNPPKMVRSPKDKNEEKNIPKMARKLEPLTMDDIKPDNPNYQYKLPDIKSVAIEFPNQPKKSQFASDRRKRVLKDQVAQKQLNKTPAPKPDEKDKKDKKTPKDTQIVKATPEPKAKTPQTDESQKPLKHQVSSSEIAKQMKDLRKDIKGVKAFLRKHRTVKAVKASYKVWGKKLTRQAIRQHKKRLEKLTEDMEKLRGEKLRLQKIEEKRKLKEKLKKQV